MSKLVFQTLFSNMHSKASVRLSSSSGESENVIELQVPSGVYSMSSRCLLKWSVSKQIPLNCLSSLLCCFLYIYEEQYDKNMVETWITLYSQLSHCKCLIPYFSVSVQRKIFLHNLNRASLGSVALMIIVF